MDSYTTPPVPHSHASSSSPNVSSTFLVDVVVAIASSCGKDVQWATALATHFEVVVLEQCDGEPINATRISTLEAPGGARFIRVSPNLGREAHAYLWYIVHHYHQLREFTAFLQSDAPRHLHKSPQDISSQLRHAFLARFSFLSLTGNAVAVGFKVSCPLETFCGIYANFSLPAPGPGAPCRPWNSVTWAHFAASRIAIQTHKRDAYRHLLDVFEDRNASARAFRPRDLAADPADAVQSGHIAGATVLERSWSFIFGCARPLGAEECNFRSNTSEEELNRRCHFLRRPLYNARLVPAELEKGEKLGCKRVHPFNVVPPTIRSQPVGRAVPSPPPSPPPLPPPSPP